MMFRNAALRSGRQLAATAVRRSQPAVCATLLSLPLSPATHDLKKIHFSTETKPAAVLEEMPLSETTKVSRELAQLQQQTWESYLASGRGCMTLFQLLDTQASGAISYPEMKFFLDSIQCKSVSAKAKQEMMDRVSDHPVEFPEFQSWLVRSTRPLKGGRNAGVRASYEAHPELGERYEPNREGKDLYSWNISTMSQALRRMQYAVRGEVVMRADKLKSEGREITFTNIGNPHAVGQEPITFYRQVLALCDLPAEFGVDNPDIAKIFPKDAIERAREMRAAIGPAGTGAYTNSQGIAEFRKHVAEYITERDGHPSYAGNIFLTNGASSAIEMVMTGLIANNKDAIMVPIPQYPIYSALIARLGGRQVGYELDESLGWAVTREELEDQLQEATEQGLHVKAMAMINPGNPTGQVLGREDLEVICKFCAENGIVLLADEVYQRNIYVDGANFISAKKVALETPGCENLQLISFHSTSKGLIGECGRRGGYMELHHIDPYVQSQLYKLASSGLCSGVAGQAMTSLMVKPPQPGGESYERFVAEEKAIYDSLKRRAAALVEGLNAIDGIECENAEGAMYAFPRITVPQKAIEEAESDGHTPDDLYALSLLEETGICVVPASGFGQKDGRVGFRTTFLPPEEQMIKAIGEFKRHHELFCKKYE